VLNNYYASKDRSAPHSGRGEQPSMGMPGEAMPSAVKAVDRLFPV